MDHGGWHLYSLFFFSPQNALELPFSTWSSAMTDQEFVLCKWKRRLWPAKVTRNEEMFVAVAWKGLKRSRREGRGPSKRVRTRLSWSVVMPPALEEPAGKMERAWRDGTRGNNFPLPDGQVRWDIEMEFLVLRVVIWKLGGFDQHLGKTSLAFLVFFCSTSFLPQ